MLVSPFHDLAVHPFNEPEPRNLLTMGNTVGLRSIVSHDYGYPITKRLIHNSEHLDAACGERDYYEAKLSKPKNILRRLLRLN